MKKSLLHTQECFESIQKALTLTGNLIQAACVKDKRNDLLDDGLQSRLKSEKGDKRYEPEPPRH
jgi:hypothetical protein